MLTGLYIHRESPVHRLRAGTKLLILALFSLIMLQIRDPFLLSGVTFGVLILFHVAQLSFRDLYNQIKPIAFLLLVLFSVQVLMDDWITAFLITGRLLLLILLASLVTITTRFSEMMDAMQIAAAPFQRFGFNPEKFALAAAVTIRFIPVLLDQFNAIREAQQVRGGGRNMIFLLPPLLIRTLRMADDLADAIDARGFDSTPIEKNRTLAK